MERSDAVAAANEKDGGTVGRKGKSVPKRPHQVDFVALAHGGERNGSAADHAEKQRQDAGVRVRIADADRTAQRRGVQGGNADMDELPGHGRGRNARRAEAEQTIVGAQILI